MVQAHIHFSGTVQGVGFRYTCLNFAKELSLTGWVKNLPDGQVEAVVAGPRPDVEELIERLKDHFHCEEQVEWAEVKGEFQQFYIAF